MLSPTTNDVVAELLSIRSSGGYATSSEAAETLLRSAKRGQTAVLKDDFERPAGYIAWARINKESYVNFINSGKFPKYHYEWAEGHIILLADVVAYQGAAKFLRRLLLECFGGHRVVVFVRASVVSVYARRRGRFCLVSRTPVSVRPAAPAGGRTAYQSKPL